jgi:hypothetical protein
LFIWFIVHSSFGLVLCSRSMICVLFVLVSILAGLGTAQPTCGSTNNPNDGPYITVTPHPTDIEGQAVPFAVYRADVQQTWVFYKNSATWYAAASTNGVTFPAKSALSNLASGDVAVSAAFIPADGIFLVAYRTSGGTSPSNLYVDTFQIGACSNSQPCLSTSHILIGTSIQTPTLTNLADGTTSLMWLNGTGIPQISIYSSGWPSSNPLWLDDTVVFDGAISVSSSNVVTLWAAHVPAVGSGSWRWAQYDGNFCGSVQPSYPGWDVAIQYSQGSIVQSKASTLLIFASKPSAQQQSQLSYATYQNQAWTVRGVFGNPAIQVLTAPSAVFAQGGRTMVYYFAPNQKYLQVAY